MFGPRSGSQSVGPDQRTSPPTFAEWITGPARTKWHPLSPHLAQGVMWPWRRGGSEVARPIPPCNPRAAAPTFHGDGRFLMEELRWDSTTGRLEYRWGPVKTDLAAESERIHRQIREAKARRKEGTPPFRSGSTDPERGAPSK